MQLTLFKKVVWSYYTSNKRELPWRKTDNPYCILVSEVMLQQTQVNRVIEKYELFIKTFPDITSLAKTPLPLVLSLWQGLGYNRRALYLQQAAKAISDKFNGTFPTDQLTLQTLPGIGPNTAGAILAYAYNRPAIFIETNIRSVFLYHFFQNKIDVHDKDIIPFIEKTIDSKNPREWYWALMDYGTFIKKEYKNPSRKSAHYTKQSAFVGSTRQLRGHILRVLIKHRSLTIGKLLQPTDKTRGMQVLKDLIKDNLVTKSGKQYMIRQK